MIRIAYTLDEPSMQTQNAPFERGGLSNSPEDTPPHNTDYFN